jgi:2-polyprenyl-3-methyl-5-hydroxy-6-metoxy-1,4-benzoquinol methylase
LKSSKAARSQVLRSSERYYSRRAGYYDLLAQRRRSDKETPLEVAFLEHAFRTRATHPVKTVLDIACGGGRHIVGLAQRGYQCTGYDLARERIDAARTRAGRAGVSLELRQGDATKLHPARRFDAVLALYILFLLPSDEDVKRCLVQIHNLLLPGGVVVCNYFNPFPMGESSFTELLKQGRTVEESYAPGIRITEIARLRDYDPVHGVAWIDETTFVEAPDGRHVFRDKERIRFFTYWDLARYLQEAGFKDTWFYPDWKQKPARKPKAKQVVLVARR